MLFLAAALILGTAAQEEAPEALTPLEVSIVLSRQDGDGELLRAPYTLFVLAGRARASELRTGLEVPVAVGDGGGDREPSRRFQYRNVGVNLTCRAFPLDEGRFRVVVDVERSSVSEDAAPPVLPRFHTLSSSAELVLADGETARAAAGTDPATGTAWTVEVTLRRR